MRHLRFLLPCLLILGTTRNLESAAAGETIYPYTCGLTQRDLEQTSGCSGKQCERTYSIYIPPEQCDSSASVPNDILPIVFALHCYGCPPSVMMHWSEIALKYNFILIVPKGYKESWNAVSCCGDALEQNIDDVGFYQLIAKDIATMYPFLMPSNVNGGMLAYAMGWSNGGFMATHLAKVQSTKVQQNNEVKFRAVAPISGYNPQDIPLQPTPLFMHHSENDNLVSVAGCCTDPTSKRCCCGISNLEHICTPAMTFFQQWSKDANKCTGGISISYAGGDDKPINCYTGVNCQANATFCLHEKGGHFNNPSLEKAFPMMTDIADFFARDACSINGGKWNSESKQCVCALSRDGFVNDGKYCLVPLRDLKFFSRFSKKVRMDSFTVLLKLVAFLGALVFLWLLFKNLRRRKGSKVYDPVALNDDDVSIENIELNQKKPSYNKRY